MGICLVISKEFPILHKNSITNKNFTIMAKKFPRTCSITGKGMNAGWIVNDGEMYIADEAKAIAQAKAVGYEGLDDAYNDDYMYYTEWSDDDIDEDELIDAVIEQIKEDIASDDVTALDELLRNVDVKILLSYLPERD